MPLTFIYTLSEPNSDCVRYVGKTVDMNSRFAGHLCEKTKTKKNNWIRSLKLRGALPRMELLEIVDSENDTDWQDAERYWIESFRNFGFRMLNLDSGGRGAKRVSEETKAKIAKANFGKIRTSEMRERMSEAWFASSKSRIHLSELIRKNTGSKRRPEKPTIPKEVRDAKRSERLRLAWQKRRLTPVSLETRKKMSNARLKKNANKS